MTHAPSKPRSNPARWRGISRPLRLTALAVPIALLIAAALVIPLWVPALPRPFRRALTEAMLRTVLVAYSALFLTAVVGTPVLGWRLAQSWRGGKPRPGIQHGFLAGLSCLLSLALLELGSSAWRAWLHRFPPLPTRFAAAPADLYRIVVLGGSSALGEPYRPWLSVGQIVTWQLQQAIEGRRFECEILARLGDSLEMQHHKLAGLKRRPHAVIIYSGHNEFAARFEEEREGWPDEEPKAWLLVGAYRATLSSPFCTLVYEVISKNRLDAPPPLSGRHQLIDPPQCSPSESAAILDDFQRRLEALVSYCERIGALSILIVPPANEAGYEPSRSTLPGSVPELDRLGLVERMENARALEWRDPAASAAAYRSILERHPGFAEAHFRLARLLEQKGRLTDAALHYLEALDHDGLPIRCQAPFRAAYEEVARRHPRSILIDGRRELAAASPDGLLGDHVIQDTHHPTLQGQVALAGAVLRELDRRQVFSLPHTRTVPLDPAACADHFALDANRWATMCERTSEHYKRVAGYRYDPAERLGKARRYALALERIRGGTPVDDLGLPGIGARPRAGKRAPASLDETPRPAANEPKNRETLRSRASRSTGSLNDLFHLPILQVDHRSPAQEANHGHELIPLGAAQHLTNHPGQGAGHDADRRTDGNCVFRGDRQARAEHGIDLAEIARQCLLVADLDHTHQPIGAQREQSIVEIALQEHVAREQRNDRLNLPPLGRATFFQHLGKIVDHPQIAEISGGRFFLTGLGVQAPPDRLLRGRDRQTIIPEIRGVAVGLGGQNRHHQARNLNSTRCSCDCDFKPVDHVIFSPR